MDEVDDFGSVAWDSVPTEAVSTPLASSSRLGVQNEDPIEPILTEQVDGIHSVSVHTPIKELEGTKEAFVSYLVSVKVSSSMPLLSAH